MGYACQLAGCDRYDAQMLSASGIYYVCPACKDNIACLTAMYQEQDAADAILASRAVTA
jgi:hypothetical protein